MSLKMNYHFFFRSNIMIFKQSFLFLKSEEKSPDPFSLPPLVRNNTHPPPSSYLPYRSSLSHRRASERVCQTSMLLRTHACPHSGSPLVRISLLSIRISKFQQNVGMERRKISYFPYTCGTTLWRFYSVTVSSLIFEVQNWGNNLEDKILFSIYRRGSGRNLAYEFRST